MIRPSSSPVVPLIDVRGLVKSYDGRVVLDGISIAVDRGETCVIIGGSGSGKSTFARILVGLERPDSGEVRIDGVDLAGLGGRSLDEVRSKFAVVFQSRALLDSMSVFDNVAFPMRERALYSEATIGERVHLALRELDVDAASAKLPAELSGGMAKRVGIARAIVVEPEIIVYDEPTSGLDPISARVVDRLIERMRVRHGVTSVVITHDMVTAYEVADRVVLFDGGKVIAQDAPELLFRSHGKQIDAFATSSGVDLTKLAPRTSRQPASAIRAARPYPRPAESHHHGWWPWSRDA